MGNESGSEKTDGVIHGEYFPIVSITCRNVNFSLVYLWNSVLPVMSVHRREVGIHADCSCFSATVSFLVLRFKYGHSAPSKLFENGLLLEKIIFDCIIGLRNRFAPHREIFIVFKA